MALAQLATGRGEDAERSFDELRRRAAQLPSEREIRRVHHLAGQIALQRGEYDRAVQELLSAEKRLPRYIAGSPGSGGGIAAVVAPQIWFALASAYAAAGRFSEAEPWFQRVVDSTLGRVNAPVEYVRSLYVLGTIHEKRRDVQKARAEYRLFLEHWRDGDLDRDHVRDAERKLALVTTS